MEKYKVAIIHNIMAPYRIPLFDNLSQNSNINLTVFFCAETHKMRKWSLIKSNKFNYKVLHGLTIEKFGIIYHINPTIIYEIIRGKYDVIIISGYSDFTSQVSFLTSRLTNTPIILWTEGVSTSQSLLGKLISPLTSYIVKKSTAIIVPGTKSRDFQIQMGSNPKKIFIAPNIVLNDYYINNSQKYKENVGEIKSKLKINSKKVILYVGRLVQNKGIYYLLNAYKDIYDEFPDTCLLIVGDGDLKSSLLELCIKDRIPNVHFVGWANNDDLVKYYSISDIFVLPTLKDVWGLVVNEAMCCRLPIITTNVAGCSKDMVIEGENGFIIDPKDSSQLSSAIRKMLINDELAKKMGDKSLTIILNNFTCDNMVNGFMTAIKYSHDVANRRI